MRLPRGISSTSVGATRVTHAMKDASKACPCSLSSAPLCHVVYVCELTVACTSLFIHARGFRPMRQCRRDVAVRVLSLIPTPLCTICRTEGRSRHERSQRGPRLKAMRFKPHFMWSCGAAGARHAYFRILRRRNALPITTVLSHSPHCGAGARANCCFEKRNGIGECATCPGESSLTQAEYRSRTKKGKEGRKEGRQAQNK